MNLTKRFLQAVFAAVFAIGTLVIAAAPASASSYTIKMGADNGMLAFEPKDLTVSAGDTVSWQINKMPPHNVVFDDGKAPDADLAKAMSNTKMMFASGDTYDVTIPADATPGTYTYFCSPHRGAGMLGKLTIQ
ncbi:MAG: plastocyanin [Geitlerinemataceae cyanobacterium]